MVDTNSLGAALSTAIAFPFWAVSALFLLAGALFVLAFVEYWRAESYSRQVETLLQQRAVEQDRLVWLASSRDSLARAVGARYIGVTYRDDPTDTGAWLFGSPSDLPAGPPVRIRTGHAV